MSDTYLPGDKMVFVVIIHTVFSIMIRIPENAYNLNYPEIKPSSGLPCSSHDIWLQGTRHASFCSYD